MVERDLDNTMANWEAGDKHRAIQQCIEYLSTEDQITFWLHVLCMKPGISYADRLATATQQTEMVRLAYQIGQTLDTTQNCSYC